MGIVITLMAVLLLSAIGASLSLISATDVTIAGHFDRAHEARHAAAGAVELVSLELRDLPDWNPVLEGVVRSVGAVGSPGGVRTVAGRPVNLDQLRSLLECGQLAPCSDAATAAVSAERPWGADNPRWNLFRYGPWASFTGAPSTLYVVVLVADDTAEQDGDPRQDSQQGAPGGGRIRVRAEAFGAQGAHAAAEALLERNDENSAELRVLASHFVAGGSP